MKKSIFALIVISGFIGLLLGVGYTSQIINSTPASSVQNQIRESPKPEVAEPATISIPRLNVNTLVESVGEDDTGRMDVPKGVYNVGWYNLGFKPGENGNAVLAGHLDTVTGAPAVFYSLNNLVEGDKVIVWDKSGKQLNFTVTKKASYSFDQVPLEEIFAQSNKPRLNLITCAGTWDVGSKNYSNRIVVYTEANQI